MAEKYIGDYVNTNDFKIQELARVLDATLGELNPQGLVTGQNCLSILKFLREFPGFESFVSSGFKDRVDQEIDGTSSLSANSNVRGPVKKILTYPRTTYLPWHDVDVDPEVFRQIQSSAEQIDFQLRLVEGKVYGVCISSFTLNELVYDYLAPQLHGLKPNIETCHITLVNSDVVAKLGVEEVRSFLDEHPKFFKISLGKIKSTYSEDWSRFGECYVIEISSAYLDQFIDAFNVKFAHKIQVAKHVTFAIRPRSLW